VVEIASIAREAGQPYKNGRFVYRSEVDTFRTPALETKGKRVNCVVEEMRGEKIDLIKYCEDPEEYIAEALAPAEVTA
jgi:N utilization substance protein A